MLSIKPIWAIVLRHLRLWRRDINILLFILYWPLLDIITWGYLGTWIGQFVQFQNYETIALLGILLWQVVGRGCNIICSALCEELWSNSLINLFSTPLKTSTGQAENSAIDMLSRRLGTGEFKGQNADLKSHYFKKVQDFFAKTGRNLLGMESVDDAHMLGYGKNAENFGSSVLKLFATWTSASKSDLNSDNASTRKSDFSSMSDSLISSLFS